MWKQCVTFPRFFVKAGIRDLGNVPGLSRQGVVMCEQIISMEYLYPNEAFWVWDNETIYVMDEVLPSGRRLAHVQGNPRALIVFEPTDLVKILA